MLTCFKHRRSFLWLFAIAIAAMANAASDSKAPAFDFRGVGFFERWSQGSQREFTPENQEDLDRWTEMITLNGYPDVHDGEGLAAAANAVLENYKSHGGKVLKTNSVPRTAEHPAEHFIAVSFTQPAFIEIAFARFKIGENEGESVVYSRRFYGEKKSDEAGAWIKAEGDAVEKALMEWKGNVEGRK